MSNKAPAFQFYPDKWESHTKHLSDYAYRTYHMLICWMWQHSKDKCSIEADYKAVAVVLGQPANKICDAMKEICNPYMPLLKERRGRWVNDGIRKEAEKQRKKRQDASDAAKSRWSKGLGGMRPHSDRIATASVSQCTPSPSPSPSPDTPLTPQKGVRKNRLTQAEKKRRKVGANSSEMVRIGGWFGRKPSTLWTLAEAEALESLEPIHPDDIKIMEQYYTADAGKDDYRRRDVYTLLNNWHSELDRARKHKPKRPECF